MNKIIALWAVPRSRSTAFQWMMKQRGDFITLHEPFGKSAYYSEERIFNAADYLPSRSEYNYQMVLQNLLLTAEKKQLFIKDMPKNFIHIVDNQFLSYFQHTFLIRHPAKMLPSYFHAWSDLPIENAGYENLYQLFENVADYTGQIPPLIDSDDLVNHPEAIVKAYCKKIGVPFIKNALTWEPPKDSKEVSWWDGGSDWHDYLSTTKGFQKQTKSFYSNVNENDVLKRLYDICLPYYEKLYTHRVLI
ncbi:hypothetical protein QUF90_08820 [Desulfococcaceae bacterium HSG9]|nr:hypothetical protein [Desulfococcaceae bacterium HSG9]